MNRILLPLLAWLLFWSGENISAVPKGAEKDDDWLKRRYLESLSRNAKLKPRTAPKPVTVHDLAPLEKVELHFEKPFGTFKQSVYGHITREDEIHITVKEMNIIINGVVILGDERVLTGSGSLLARLVYNRSLLKSESDLESLYRRYEDVYSEEYKTNWWAKPPTKKYKELEVVTAKILADDKVKWVEFDYQIAELKGNAYIEVVVGPLNPRIYNEYRKYYDLNLDDYVFRHRIDMDKTDRSPKTFRRRFHFRRSHPMGFFMGVTKSLEEDYICSVRVGTSKIVGNRIAVVVDDFRVADIED